MAKMTAAERKNLDIFVARYLIAHPNGFFYNDFKIDLIGNGFEPFFAFSHFLDHYPNKAGLWEDKEDGHWASTMYGCWNPDELEKYLKNKYKL